MSPEPDSENTKLASSPHRPSDFFPCPWYTFKDKVFFLSDQTWTGCPADWSDCYRSYEYRIYVQFKSDWQFPFLTGLSGGMAMPSVAGSLGQSWGSRKCFVLKLSQSGQAPADIKWVQGFQEFQRDSLMIKGYLYQKLGQHYTPRSKFQGAIRQNFFLKRKLFIWFQEAFEWQWMVAPTSRNNEGGWLNETFRKETELKNFFRWPNNSKQLEKHNRVRGKDWCLRTKSFSVWLNQTILLHGFVHVLITEIIALSER